MHVYVYNAYPTPTTQQINARTQKQKRLQIRKWFKSELARRCNKEVAKFILIRVRVVVAPKDVMSMDFVNERVVRNRTSTSGMDDRTVRPEDLNFTLLDIQSQLHPFPKNRMEDYHLPTPTAPVITSVDDITECTEIREHLSFDKDVESSKKDTLSDIFNDKQRTSFDIIDKSVSEGVGGCFYLDGAGGCGKTTRSLLL